MRHALALLLSIAGASLAAAPASAQDYPNRAVKIIVPTTAGGSYDIVGRLLADALQRRTGQPFVVENRPGAGSAVGTQSAAVAPADGYTLVMGGLSNMAFNPALYKNLSYRPLEDFVPISLVYTFSYILVGSKTLPEPTPAATIAAMKAKPEAFTLANGGTGTGQHVAGIAFAKAAGVKLLEVPYRGSAGVYPDLLSGRVSLFIDSAAAALPYIKGGQVKGLATLTAKRNPQAPDMPTTTELGIPNLEIDSWLGLFAPAKTPEPVVAKLRADIAAVLPELKARFVTSGGDVMTIPPEQTSAFVKKEYDRWTGLIRDAGVSLD